MLLWTCQSLLSIPVTSHLRINLGSSKGIEALHDLTPTNFPAFISSHFLSQELWSSHTGFLAVPWVQKALAAPSAWKPFPSLPPDLLVHLHRSCSVITMPERPRLTTPSAISPSTHLLCCVILHSTYSYWTHDIFVYSCIVCFLLLDCKPLEGRDFVSLFKCYIPRA